MLHNPKYIGKCRYGGEIYENMIEPIIDEATFYKAQEKLTENVHKAARSKAAEKFILSGKIICAECGEFMAERAAQARPAKSIPITNAPTKPEVLKNETAVRRFY